MTLENTRSYVSAEDTDIRREDMVRCSVVSTEGTVTDMRTVYIRHNEDRQGVTYKISEKYTDCRF